MGKVQYNNYITIAKAMGIILMVIGHSGCPKLLFNAIYLFHMPLFFFCSGIFYREMLSKDSVSVFLKKKVTGLYIPFVKWSVLFLLLHNLLLAVGIYNAQYGFEGGSHYYSVYDILWRLCMILFTMTGYEELLGGFWFIRSLFVSCLLIAIVSLIFRSSFKYKYASIGLFFLFITIIIRRLAPDVVFFRELSMGSFGALFYMFGYLLKPYERFWQNKYGAIVCCLFLLAFLYYFKGGISMGCGYNKVIPFFISATSGIFLTIYMSKLIEERLSMITSFLYYTGNHTLEILSLHFLSFRFVSFVFTIIYGIDVAHISEHPVISDVDTFSCYWWIFYTVAGIVIPLLLYKIWQTAIYYFQR